MNIEEGNQMVSWLSVRAKTDEDEEALEKAIEITTKRYLQETEELQMMDNDPHLNVFLEAPKESSIWHIMVEVDAFFEGAFLAFKSIGETR